MLQAQLFAMQDLAYRDFHARLMPTVPKDTIIGIRVPVLRNFAKQFFKTEEKNAFLRCLPHTFYEENNLHAFLIEQIEDFETALAETERFLPYIDNWATCDSFLPKAFKANKAALLPHIDRWLKSEHPFTVRYALSMLLRLFLDEAFNPVYLQKAAAVQSEDYYVQMMVAWYFATALAKQYDFALPYLTEKRLAPPIHNKAIQKAVESYRIPKETKLFLKTLKI